jgi:galactokinase
MKDELAKKYEQIFGKAPQEVSFAPGRVNLIGEHTDYNDGFVFPMTIQYGTSCAIGKNDEGKISLYSLNSDDFVIFKVGEYPKESKWYDYIIGCLQELPLGSGFNAVFTGNVPQGAGLSSSASLQLSFLRAMSDLFKFDLSPQNAALLAQRCENTFVGCNSGIMDQFICSLGKEGHAMLLDCESLDFQNCELPDEIDVIVVNSNVKRGLVDSEYNDRRETCERSARRLGVKSLRELKSLTEDQKSLLTELELKRVEHVISENRRVQAFKKSLKNGDIQSIFRLMEQGHQSLKDNYEVSVPAVDYLCALVSSKYQGSAGARMTGGGFGGCVVILTVRTSSESIIQDIEEHYSKHTGLKEDIYTVHSTNGAFN